MDSEESRPASSASNSSSSSVESNENVENGSMSSSRKSRSKSVNSNSSSASSSRNQSPESQNAVLKEPQSPVQQYQDSRSRSMSRGSNHSEMSNGSSEGRANGSTHSRRNSGSSGRQNQAYSRNQSVSPTRQSGSRNSSVSSIPDGANNEQSRNDAIHISHEDLSDVSDLESATASPMNIDNADENGDGKSVVDLRQKINEKKSQQKTVTDKQGDQGSKQSPSIVDELNDIIQLDKKHDEDALDFEAEDGECADEKEEKPVETKEPESKSKKDSDGEIEEGEELEEGEVSDEDEKRPEETEPKPVCRFYTRGQCTWGMSCRFLHPGVTDKGNYTMFDMIRPVPVNAHAPPYGPGGAVPSYHHDFRSERPNMHAMHPGNAPPQARPMAEPVVESAWERGLRTAKEMMRKANKRKEQDMDFEDKKMNLSASQDELEKDNYYIRERSPERASPQYAGRPMNVHHQNKGGFSPPHAKYGMGRPAPVPHEEDPYGRSMRYRELPAHRMPQYEDEIMAGKRRIRPTREVIVQRAEPAGRGDEWNDPWMRSKSPGREREKRQKRERRSYSSNSSYSSSSSSQSGSSSGSSRSPSPTNRRRRYSSTRASSHKSPVRGRHVKRSATPEGHKRRHSPAARRSPTKKRQPTPPSAEKRANRSPVNKRKRASPPPPPPRKPISFSIATSNNLRKKKRSSSSGSGSSDSSASDSGSSDSSSSSESSSRNGHKSRSRDKVISERKLASKKVEAAAKKRSPPAQSGSGKAAAESTTNNSSKSNSSSSAANSKKSTRREELLKQLRAVEDAIARKRSKLS